MLKELTTYNLEEIQYSFVVDSVSAINLGEFSNVISEMKCYLRGTIGEETRDRYFVHKLDTSNISSDDFIDIDKLTKQNLTEWVEKSIHPDNLKNLKQAVVDMFNPPIRNISITFFK